jgi:myo-inositol catabolism protein IolC
MAVLVDETYGEEILRDAHAKGIQTMQSVEQSGLDEFAFQYGEDFGTHLTERHATFAKALVRYNPEGDAEANARSLERLRLLSYFCHESGIKLLIEPLIPPTSAQLASVEGDKARFDTELRPALTLEMMRQFQESHIECDIWKIEGFETSSAYVSVVAQAQNTPERAGVSIIILGRGEARVKVTEWINAGKHVPGVIGFAVGRTVFWEPLVSYRDEQLTRDETISLISKNFSEFCLLFEAS